MPEFKVSDVKAIRETYNERIANKYLKDRWILLDKSVGKDEAGFPIVLYILGWTHEDEPKPAYDYN